MGPESNDKIEEMADLDIIQGLTKYNPKINFLVQFV